MTLAISGIGYVGLRYFNVFGKRQDPNGAYAAVTPKWAAAMTKGEDVYVNGDGECSRDSCDIDNAVQANLLAANMCEAAKNEVNNVGCNDRTSLNQLFAYLKTALQERGVDIKKEPIFKDFWAGDVRHSSANIGQIQDKLGYEVSFRVRKGIAKVIPWYMRT